MYSADADFATELEARKEELKRTFIVSELIIAGSKEELEEACVTTAGWEAGDESVRAAGVGCEGGVTVGVAKASGGKCARCWGYFTDLGGDDRHPELCPRCTSVVVEVDPELTVPATTKEAAAAASV